MGGRQLSFRGARSSSAWRAAGSPWAASIQRSVDPAHHSWRPALREQVRALWGCPAAQTGLIASINRLAAPLATGCHQLTPRSNAGTVLAGRGASTGATIQPVCVWGSRRATATRRWPVSVGSRRCRRRLHARSLAATSQRAGLAGCCCALICAATSSPKPPMQFTYDLPVCRRSHNLQARRRGAAADQQVAVRRSSLRHS